jgi:hypothetical protein
LLSKPPRAIAAAFSRGHGKGGDGLRATTVSRDRSMFY